LLRVVPRWNPQPLPRLPLLLPEFPPAAKNKKY
jgi:hypothetical protein